MSASARRYARALLEVARESGDPGEVRGELARLSALLRGHGPLRALLHNPALPDRIKKQVAAGLGEKTGWSQLVRRLLELLIERDRTELLPALERAYAELWNAERGVVSAEAVVARPLAADQLQALGAAIRRATGLEAEVETRVDPVLVGGIVLRMGGRTYDGSVRSRLAGLRSRLVEGRPA